MIPLSTIVDMHIHSCASDSTHTPVEIINELLEKNIGIASLTDHNTISNQHDFLGLASANGIHAISGVEISCKTGDMVYHILAYGFKPDDNRVSAYVDPLLAMMKNNNRELIIKMSYDYDEIDISEYDKYSYDRTRGGWEFVNYLQDKGVVEKSIDGLAFYNIYNSRLSNCDYPSPEEVIKEVLSWGAYPVLAHPNAYYRKGPPSTESIYELFDLFKSYGLRGVECYYRSHDEFMTKTCLDWCQSNNMMITIGNDSHGEFVPGREIGKMRIPLESLNIDILLGN